LSGLRCYRCGESIAALSLPLRRLDGCPACGADLHVCRMCRSFAPRLSGSCSEDDAPEVRDKASANFCDFFVPSASAYDATRSSADGRARSELASLFGDGDNDGDTADPGSEPSDRDELLDKARSLFEK
jgi:hypothetical protein